MKKFIKSATIFAVLLAVMVPLAFADTTLAQNTPFDNISGNITNFDSLIKLLLRIAVAIAILWTLFNLIKAGIQYTGAGADAGKKKEALGSVISAVVGLVIVLLSLVILYFVGGFVGVNPDTAVTTLNNLGPCDVNGTRGVKVQCADGSGGATCTTSNLASAPTYCKTINSDGTPNYTKK